MLTRSQGEFPRPTSRRPRSTSRRPRSKSPGPRSRSQPRHEGEDTGCSSDSNSLEQSWRQHPVIKGYAIGLIIALCISFDSMTVPEHRWYMFLWTTVGIHRVVHVVVAFFFDKRWTPAYLSVAVLSMLLFVLPPPRLFSWWVENIEITWNKNFSCQWKVIWVLFDIVESAGVYYEWPVVTFGLHVYVLWSVGYWPETYRRINNCFICCLYTSFIWKFVISYMYTYWKESSADDTISLRTGIALCLEYVEKNRKGLVITVGAIMLLCMFLKAYSAANNWNAPSFIAINALIMTFVACLKTVHSLLE